MARDNGGENRKRRDIIVEAAAKHFARSGYDATTMRAIASDTGILPGSIYYHFASKDELFLAVHERAINIICDGVLRKMHPDAGAWEKLEQAAEGYLEAMLGNYEDASIIVTEFPRRRGGKLRDKMVADRRRFENIFTEIVADLPLREGIDRTYWRLALLGMLAWAYVWYNPKGDPPRVLARTFIHMLRERTDS